MARRGFVFLRSPAEPVQQASRTGGSPRRTPAGRRRGGPAGAPRYRVGALLGAGVPGGLDRRTQRMPGGGRKRRPSAAHLRGRSSSGSGFGRSGKRSVVLLAQLLHVLGPAVARRCAVRVRQTRSPSPLALARSSGGHSSGPRRRRNVSWSRHGSNKAAFGSKLPRADAGAQSAWQWVASVARRGNAPRAEGRRAQGALSRCLRRTSSTWRGRLSGPVRSSLVADRRPRPRRRRRRAAIWSRWLMFCVSAVPDVAFTRLSRPVRSPADCRAQANVVRESDPRSTAFAAV